MNLDDLIDGVGGMSRFQVLMMFFIMGPKILMSWGMLMMTFAGAAPEQWACLHDVVGDVSANNTSDFFSGMETKVCPSDNNTESCVFVYSSDKNTVINEWDLVCGMKGIKPFITSLQMAGVLVGALIGGQSADGIGRKKTYYLSQVLHAGFNLVAAFSVSWQMFAALRFFIGMMVGSMLVVAVPYFMEFVGRKWRPITVAVPMWATGSCLLAMSAWLRPDWAQLHIILVAMHVPFLFGWLFVPESLRWLTVHGRLDKAEEVVQQIARYNRKHVPHNTRLVLETLASEEQRGLGADKKYTYLDVYRGWAICWKSMIIQWTWLSLSMVYYAIVFGVGRLTGSLYLNMFLIALLGVPAALMVYVIDKKIGRRWTAFTAFLVATLAACGVVIVTKVVPDSDSRGSVITGLALLCRFGVAAAWNCYMTRTCETYPTVIRNLGYGAANTAARVGGIISPYVFAMGGSDLFVPFVIVGCVLATCTVLSLVLPETKDIPFEDTTLASPSATKGNHEPEKHKPLPLNNVHVHL